MKKFLITYIIFSLLIGVAIYFVTLTLSYNQRVYDVYYELAEQAAETKEFDEFISMQAVYYKSIGSYQNDDYMIETYQVIGRNGETYINQLGIFILPFTDVKYADNVEDPNDETGIRIIRKDGGNPNETFYETYTDEAYEGAAVSYGLTLMDFYFYAIEFDEDILIDVELYDYDGNMLIGFEEDLIFENNATDNSSFEPGMKPSRLEELVDQETHVFPNLIQNMTIFIVVDIVVGSVIYFIIKRKKQ